MEFGKTRKRCIIGRYMVFGEDIMANMVNVNDPIDRLK